MYINNSPFYASKNSKWLYDVCLPTIVVNGLAKITILPIWAISKASRRTIHCHNEYFLE